ncbi:hypothetical protein WDU94_004749 [Cyamophila willieti]
MSNPCQTSGICQAAQSWTSMYTGGLDSFFGTGLNVAMIIICIIGMLVPLLDLIAIVAVTNGSGFLCRWGDQIINALVCAIVLVLVLLGERIPPNVHLAMNIVWFITFIWIIGNILVYISMMINPSQSTLVGTLIAPGYGNKSVKGQNQDEPIVGVQPDGRDLHITLELTINQNNIYDASSNKTVNVKHIDDDTDGGIDDFILMYDGPAPPEQDSYYYDRVNNYLDTDMTYEDYYHQKHDLYLLMNYLDLEPENLATGDNNPSEKDAPNNYFDNVLQDYSLEQSTDNDALDKFLQDNTNSLPDGFGVFVSSPLGPEDEKPPGYWLSYFDSNLTDPANFTYKDVNLETRSDGKHHPKKHSENKEPNDGRLWAW